MTCILGRNGVGKTSLLRAIFGLQTVRAGRIIWEDQILNGLRPHERARSGLALVPQGREIFARLTVLENLETGFAPLAPSCTKSRMRYSLYFRRCKGCCTDGAVIFPAASSSNWR